MAKTKENKSVKRTYTLSFETSDQFERLVPPGQRSQVVEGLLQKEMEQVRRQHLRDSIAVGLAEMADVNVETCYEWEATETEDWPNP
jgi:hypothetical protein